jgi:hypothetical protein
VIVDDDGAAKRIGAPVEPDCSFETFVINRSRAEVEIQTRDYAPASAPTCRTTTSRPATTHRPARQPAARRHVAAARCARHDREDRSVSNPAEIDHRRRRRSQAELGIADVADLVSQV